MGNLESERKKKCHCLVTTTIAPLFQIASTKLEEHERRHFAFWEERAEDTCCCTSSFTNHSSKGLPHVVQVKGDVRRVSPPR